LRVAKAGNRSRVPEAAGVPDCISLDVHRDDRHLVERVCRWALVAALVALSVAGLANVFGQRPVESSATGDEATLSLSAPGALRSGLYFQGRFRIEAESDVSEPTLVLDAGWFDAITVNTVQPEPTTVAGEGDRVSFAYEPLRAGRTLTVYVELQVNPTTFGRRQQGVELRDGRRTITAIERSVTVFP
jgi:hypothetical protein